MLQTERQLFFFREAIEKIDARFDLVMITDRFEESIILMKEMLCMSDDDVIYLALKVRRETQPGFHYVHKKTHLV